MSHKTEAEKLLYLAYNEISDSEGFFEVQAAFAEATLALVEAQEAANEQARIANLIALAGLRSDNCEDEFVRLEALYSLIGSVPHGPHDEHTEILPDIARALKIRGAE